MDLVVLKVPAVLALSLHVSLPVVVLGHDPWARLGSLAILQYPLVAQFVPMLFLSLG